MRHKNTPTAFLLTAGTAAAGFLSVFGGCSTTPDSYQYPTKVAIIDDGFAPDDGFNNTKYIPMVANNQPSNGVITHGAQVSGVFMTYTAFTPSQSVEVTQYGIVDSSVLEANPCNGWTISETLPAAIYAATAAGHNIINLSLSRRDGNGNSGEFEPNTEMAIINAVERGVIVICSAGNAFSFDNSDRAAQMARMNPEGAPGIAVLAGYGYGEYIFGETPGAAAQYTVTVPGYAIPSTLAYVKETNSLTLGLFYGSSASAPILAAVCTRESQETGLTGQQLMLHIQENFGFDQGAPGTDSIYGRFSLTAPEIAFTLPNSLLAAQAEAYTAEQVQAQLVVRPPQPCIPPIGKSITTTGIFGGDKRPNLSWFLIAQQSRQ